jgi:hypothetical protein
MIIYLPRSRKKPEARRYFELALQARRDIAIKSGEAKLLTYLARCEEP